MAITEEQARTRTEQRASQPTNNTRASPNASSNQQRNIPNQSAPNPLGNVMGLLGNFMQEFNAPGGSSHFSTATLDLSSLFGPPPPVPTNQAAGNTTIHTHQSPHGHIHIQTSTGPIIRERSGPRVQSPAPAPVPTPTSAPVPTPTSAPTEEAKVVENRTQGSNRNQNIIVLPHNHLYNANVINNELMGVNSAFPGPPLPPSGNPRTAITLLGSYLANLQFCMGRMQPFVYRAGELLQRERNLVNPVDRAESQQLVNQVGRLMEELGRALILSSHYFRDLTIGESPGEFAIRNNPHSDFSSLNNAFIDSQNIERENVNVNLQNTSITQQTSIPLQTAANTQARPSVGVNQTQNSPQNIFGSMLQNLLTPQNLNNVMGIVGGLSGNLQNNTPVQNANNSRSTANTPSQPQQDVHMRTTEETKASESAPQERRNVEERKERAELRQESLNNSFINNLNLIANAGNNPLSNIMQSFLPTFSSAMSSSQVSNPMTQSFRTLFPSDTEGETSFFRNIMLDCSTQDFIALFSGNYEILNGMHPKTKSVLLNNYMNGVDNKESRSRAADSISEEINSQVYVPEDLKPTIVRGSDPLKTISTINRKHVEKLINLILDIDCNSDDHSIFIKRIKRIVRWWIGELIDNLKPLFTNSLQDVLKLFRANIQRSIETNIEDSSGILSGMFTDTIMQSITSNYNEYSTEKAREDMIEANDIVTSNEIQRMRNEEINSKMEVDEEPKIEEETINTTFTRQSQEQPRVESKPPQPPVVKKEQPAKPEVKQEIKVEEEKDPEIKKLLDQMDEDQSMLVVDPPSNNPKSRTYKALDGYYLNNIESGNSITEMSRPKQTPKQALTNLIKDSLKEAGFAPNQVEKLMKDKEIPQEFADQYKEVIKNEIRERKQNSDYEEGRFPELDRL